MWFALLVTLAASCAISIGKVGAKATAHKQC